MEGREAGAVSGRLGGLSSSCWAWELPSAATAVMGKGFLDANQGRQDLHFLQVAQAAGFPRMPPGLGTRPPQAHQRSLRPLGEVILLSKARE